MQAAVHVWNKKHTMDLKQILLKETLNKQILTNWENILIAKPKDFVLNFEIQPENYLTKEIILTVKGRISALTKNKQLHQLVLCWKHEES